MEKEMRLLAEKVLKRETNQFLKEIERFMEEDGVGKLLASKENDHQDNGEGKKQPKVPGRTQFERLMNAAGEASCIEELLLFLAYQRSKNGGWEAICSHGEDIAKKLADSFLRVQKDVYKVIEDDIYKAMEHEDWAEKIEDDDERLLRLMIAEKYLGYLYWKVSAVSRS